MANEVDDKLMASQLENNLASIYREQGDIDTALTLYQKALEVNKAADDKYFTAIILANIGRVYNIKEQYEIAYSYLNESYEVASKVNSTYCLGLTLSYLCENYFQQKQYTKSISAAHTALNVLGENGEMESRKDFYNHLSKGYEAQGNYELAFKNQYLYHTLSDSIYSVERSKQINSLTIKYEVTQKENENKLLKSKTETAQKTIKNQTFAAIGLLLALIFAIGWGSFVYRANQQKKKLNEILEAKVEERTHELQVSNKNLA